MKIAWGAASLLVAVVAGVACSAEGNVASGTPGAATRTEQPEQPELPSSDASASPEPEPEPERLAVAPAISPTCPGMSAALVSDYAAGARGFATPEEARDAFYGGPKKGVPTQVSREGARVRFDYFAGEEFTGNVTVVALPEAGRWIGQYDVVCV